MSTTRLICSLSVLSVVLYAQAPANPAPGRLLCVFLDMNAMDATQQATARDNAIQFVQQQAQPPDRIAVMTYTSQLNVLEDFTTDHDRALASLRTITPGSAASAGDTAARLQAIRAAVEALTPLPDRKVMIYFSPGALPGGGTNADDLRDTVNAAVRANVAIYPVDSRGLVAPRQ